MDYKFIQGTCAVKWCPQDRRKKSKYCKTCAASFSRANRLGEVWVRMRHDTVSKFQSRMVYLGSEVKKEFRNVAGIIKRRRF